MAREPAAKKRRLSPPGDDGAPAAGFTRWNLEQDYEKRARKGKKDEKNKKLPIKTADGYIVDQEEAEPAPLQDDDADSFLASDDGEEAEEEKPQKPEAPKLSPKQEILQAKEELARIASVMSEDPEDNIGMLASLAEITMSKNVTVKKLGLGTMLAVFKDIIPGYRIRPIGKDDMTNKVSKEVRKLRAFEQGLLSGYKSYLQVLKGLAKGSAAKDPDTASLGSVAIACACTLLENVSHFNERSILVAIVVGKLSLRMPSGKDQDYTRCLNALEHTFQSDDDGFISMEVVTQLTKMMKSRNWQFHESVLNSLLHLRLLNEFSGKASSERVDKPVKEEEFVKKPSQKKVFRTKKRKIAKERKAIESEMKVADASVSYEERDKNQAETLKLVFLAYFRILKARVDHLMGAVLEGLARFAHLINQEFFGDILEVLKDLINEASVDLRTETGDDLDENRNALRETLLCITTAFALLHGQMDVIKSATSLHLDLDFFIKNLYNIILPLSQDPDLELSAKNRHARDPNGLEIPATASTKVNVATTTVLFLRSLQAVLLPPTNTRSVPPLRVAAFTKQLETAALHLPQKSSVAVLSLLQQVSRVHGKKMMTLWHTEDRKGDGKFDPLGPLESANPMATTVWEGELLRLHYDPKIRDTVKLMEKNLNGN
jgi:nucleolar complex protein 3